MRTYVRYAIGLIVFAFFLPQLASGQSLKRQSIGSYGTNGQTNGSIFGQTIGQPFSTIGYFDYSLSLNPGFQQPVMYKRFSSEENVEIIELKVFPNPATVSFNVESQEALKDALFMVSDVHGRILLEKKIPELLTYKVKCSDWQAGMYLITIRTSSVQNNFNASIIISK